MNRQLSASSSIPAGDGGNVVVVVDSDNNDPKPITHAPQTKPSITTPIFDIRSIENQMKLMSIDTRNIIKNNNDDCKKYLSYFKSYYKNKLSNHSTTSNGRSYIDNPFRNRQRMKSKQAHGARTHQQLRKTKVEQQNNVIVCGNEDSTDDDNELQDEQSAIDDGSDNTFNFGLNNHNRMMTSINERMASLWSREGYRNQNSRKSRHLNRIKMINSRQQRSKASRLKRRSFSWSSSDDDNSSSFMNLNSPNTSSLSSAAATSQNQTSCAQQASLYDQHQQSTTSGDTSTSVVELAAYLEETLFIPKKMSFMAEMMYT